jgi:hypothetical protein
MSEDQSKVTRRKFLQYTALTTAMTGAWYSTTMKTDAQSKVPIAPKAFAGPENNPGPYTYSDPA